MRYMLIATLAAACSGSSEMSCGGSAGELVDVAGNAIVDCVKKDPLGTAKLVIKLGKTLYELKESGELNWDGFVTQAIAFEKDNGCAAAIAVDAHTPLPGSDAPPARALMVNPDPSRDALERVRAHFGGVRWRIDGKTI